LHTIIYITTFKYIYIYIHLCLQKYLCYIRKKTEGTLIQFDNDVVYNYKTSFETFFKLTQTHSNIFEVTPGLLVNLDKLQEIIPNEEEDEFVCNLASQKNIKI
jgi:hypothetical protein